MSKIREEDIQEYYLGNPCFAGLGVRRWTPESEENKDAFVDDICATEIGKKFCSMFTAEQIIPAWNQVMAIHTDRAAIYGAEITTRTFERCLRDAIQSGLIQAPPPEAPKPRQLSSSQLAWQECERFVYGDKEAGIEPASHWQIESRKASDPVFAKWIEKNVVWPGREKPKVDTKDAALVEFAEKLKITPSDDLRPKGGEVKLAGKPMAYSVFKNLFERAISAGLA
jgi:hypothetical protein